MTSEQSPKMPKPVFSYLLVDETVQANTVFADSDECEKIFISPGIKNIAGEKNIIKHSTAPIIRRLNLAISLASGEWIIPVINDEFLDDKYHFLKKYIDENQDACALFLHFDNKNIMFAIRRSAFAYGAIDERHEILNNAMIDWSEHIFPAPKFRTIKCEGVRHIDLCNTETSPSNILRESLKSVSTGMPELRALPDYKPTEFWENGTDNYVKWEVFQPDELEIEEAICLTKPRQILELGCGAGRNIRYFSDANTYVGIDISSNLLKRAADRISANTLALIRGDVVNLPFYDSSFELVFSDSTIQHVEPERIAACVNDILRVSSRYICIIEFVDELPGGSDWFQNIHMFKHDYERLLDGKARLIKRKRTKIQIQPAVKEYFLFEKL